MELDHIENASVLVYLKYSGRGAIELPRLSHFKSLIELDLSDNQLQAPQERLDSLKFLKKLSLRNNTISALWTLPKTLEVLNLSSNLLSDLFLLRHVPRLHTLDVSNNQLEDLSFLPSIPNLKYLSAAGNRVFSLEFIDKSRIIELDLSSNRINSFENIQNFKQSRSLVQLKLTGNPLTKKVEAFAKFVEPFVLSSADIGTIHKDFENKKCNTLSDAPTALRVEEDSKVIKEEEEIIHELTKKLEKYKGLYKESLETIEKQTTEIESLREKLSKHEIEKVEKTLVMNEMQLMRINELENVCSDLYKSKEDCMNDKLDLEMDIEKLVKINIMLEEKCTNLQSSVKEAKINSFKEAKVKYFSRRKINLKLDSSVDPVTRTRCSRSNLLYNNPPKERKRLSTSRKFVSPVSNSSLHFKSKEERNGRYTPLLSQYRRNN